MNVQIFISGGISGNRAISNQLSGKLIEAKYGAKYILYSTIKEAKKDISTAFKSLKNNEPDYDNMGKSKDNTSLYYDASTAKIEAISKRNLEFLKG